MSLIEWLIVMAFFIPLMRLLGFCYDQLFRPSGRQLDVIEEDICYDEGDLGALIEIFPNLQEMECKDALILHKGDYDDAFKYLIRVSGKRGNKAKIDGLNDSFSSSSTRASAEDKRIEEITSSITDLMDIIRYPIGGEKQPREEVAALRKQIRKQLEEGSFPEVACQCGCNGRPSTICPDGSINYSIHWDCPARILRKEREKYKRYKIRKEIALKNKIERDRARKVKRKKLLKDKLIKEKEEWIERGRQGLAAQSAKEAKARN